MNEAKKAVLSRDSLHSATLQASRFLISALRADTVFIKRNTAQRTTVDALVRRKFRRRSIHTARKRNLHDVQLVFEQIVDNLYHSFHRHRFLCDDKTAFRIRSRKISLERRPLHLVARRSVSNPL